MAKHFSILLAAVVAVGLGGTPAHAQNVNDIRCALVSNAFAKSAKDQKAKRMAEGSLYFYFGRIAGRLNQAQLSAGFLAQQKAITRANAAQTMQTCFLNAQRSVKGVLSVTEQLAQRRK
jgi:hypothetical protein